MQLAKSHWSNKDEATPFYEIKIRWKVCYPMEDHITDYIIQSNSIDR